MTNVPDRGWDRLDAETKEAVIAVIAEAESSGEYTSEEFGALDIFARPDGDQVAWGVVDGAGRFGVARGVWPRALSAELIAEPRLKASEPALDRRELATVLAALRFWQREGRMSAGGEHDIAADGGQVAPLKPAEIDALCERLNVGKEPLSQSAALLDQVGEAMPADHKTVATLATALAAVREQRQLEPASEIIPLRPGGGGDDAGERQQTNTAWVNQFEAAKDEADFHRLFTALQTDPAIDAKAARHIAFALTGERHQTREAALGGMETHFYQQRDRQQQQEAAQLRGGVGR
jgi:hypothetical protein